MERSKTVFLIPMRMAMAAAGLLAWLGWPASSVLAQPTNDNFANAQVLTGIYGSVTNDNTGATAESGEPSHAGFRPQQSIWYQWTAPQNGEVEMDTFGSVFGYPAFTPGLDVLATNYQDTVLAVYTGPDLAHLTQVAANDDLVPIKQPNIESLTFASYAGPSTAGPTGPIQPFPYFAPFFGPSGVRFNAVAGTNYYIAVDSKYPVPPNFLNGTFSTIDTNYSSTGPMVLNWAYQSSGVFRFATEDIDPLVGMPLYRCTASEGIDDNESTFRTYYTYDPQGLLVTVTRAAGSSGRVLVDYTTVDGTALSNVDYVPVSGTLVFDDFEMSKTIRIPLIGLGPGAGEAQDVIFSVALSNPRLASLESPNVSPPRLDPVFATVEVLILSEQATTDDPDEYPTTSGGPPTHDVFNFAKVHYRVPRDVNSYWSTVVMWVYRTFPQTAPPDSASDIHYRIDNLLESSFDCTSWIAGELQNNFFPLNPGSDYATPTPDSTFAIHGTNSDFGNFNPGYTTCGGGTLPGFGNAGAVALTFVVTNNAITELNKDFRIQLYRTISGANFIPGENAEAWVTIMFDDSNAPAGSVDEFYNADYGDQMEPNVATTPPDDPSPGTDGLVYDLAVETNDNNATIIVGQFDSYNGTPDQNNIARLNADGTLDTTFNSGAGADDFISSLALMSNGQMIIGGAFASYDSQPNSCVARLNADGSFDSSFATGVPGLRDQFGNPATVWAVALQTNGEVFVGGDFVTINGVSRPYIALLNANGALDTSFDPTANPPNDIVQALAVTADGHVILGGAFTALGGQTANHLARLDPTGGFDSAYGLKLGSGADNTVWALSLDANGRLLAGGDFLHVNLVPRGRIARLNADGSLDTTFNPGMGANDTVYSVNPQADGTIYAGGQFSSFNGTHRLSFARLFGNGTLDTSFLDTTYNQFAGFPRLYYDKQGLGDPRPIIYASSVQSDSNIMVGGSFSRVGGGQVNTNVTSDADFPAQIYDANVWAEPKAREGIRNRSNVARLIGGSTPGPGNISLLSTNYSVNVSQRSLSVGISRNNGSLGIASANFEVLPGLASAGSDFIYNSGAPYYVSSWNLLAFAANHGNAITREHMDGLFGTNSLPTDQYGDYWETYSPGLAVVSILNSGLNAGNLDTQFQLANPSSADDLYLGGMNIPVGIALGASVGQLTIVNPSPKTNYLGFASAVFSVNESGTNAVITVVRTNGTAGSCSVKWTASNGSAVSGVNYIGLTNQTLNFGAGVTTQTFLVPVIDDHLQEPNGLTVNLQLSGISGASYGLASAVLNIIDNDGPPGFVNFSSPIFGTNVSAGSVVLTLTRSGADNGTLSVQCATTNGTAVNGVNYGGLTNTLQWNSLDFSPRYVTVPLANNGLVGSNLYFQASLVKSSATVNGASDAAAVGPTNVAIVTITNDNSYGTLEFSAANYLFDENGGSATITVVRTGGSAQNVSINYATADGPYATHTGPDPNYVATGGTLTFNPGVVSQNITVPILDDGVLDPPLTNFYFTVNLSSANPASAAGFPTTAKVYILDAETNTVPSGSPDTTFIPNPGFNGDVYSVALTAGGQMVAGGNFSAVDGANRYNIARVNADGSLDNSFLNLASGANGANGVVNSVVVQSDGQTLAAGSFGFMDGVSAGNLARLNNDGSLDTTFSSLGSGTDNPIFAMAETFVSGVRKILIGGSFLNVANAPHRGLARLNTDGSVDASFDLGLTVNGTVEAIAVYATNTIEAGKIVIGGNFTAVDGVTRGNIARLNQDGTLDSTFTPTNGATDTIRALAIQSDGTIVVGGSFTNFNGVGLNHLTRLKIDGSLDSSFNVGLGADDTVNAIAIQPDGRIVLGGSFLHASGVTRGRITRLLSSGAVDPDINFGLGANSAVYAVALQTTPLPNYGMIVLGGDFTTMNGLSRPHLARLYGNSITGSGLLQFTAGNYYVDETGTNAVINVQRVGGTEGNVSVTFSTSPGTAVSNVNYLDVTTNLVFPMGETFQTVKVPVMDDLQITPDLSVFLSLSNPTPPAQLGNQPVATLMIINDDSAISFLSTTPPEVKQNVAGGLALIGIQRVGSTSGTASVQFSTTTNGTAIPSVDYTPTNYLVTFPPGISNVNVGIPILNNPRSLNDVTVGMQLTNTDNSLLFNPSVATLTILTTNQASGQFIFAQTNFPVLANPSGTNAIVTVLRTNGHHGTITVNYQTADDTATAGYKYVATSGTLSFGDGELSQTFSIPILNVSVATGNEDFFVNLSTNLASNATISGPTNATVTILDDNIGLHFFTGQEGGSQPGTNIYTVLETAGSVTLNVERVGTNGVNTVNYATTNGTALAGVNYVATSGSLTFTNGEAIKSIQVPVIHDTNVTGDLTFLVNLSNPSPPPAQLFAPSIAEVIVQDADPGVAFTNANYYTFKSATNVLITVLRSNANTGVVSVNYATTNGTALAGVDYVATSGTLIFSNGIVFQSFPVTIINNQLIESNVTFGINLLNPLPTNTALLPPSLATVTITNDLAGFSFDAPTYSVNENGVSKTINVLRTGYTNSTVSVGFTTADGTGKAGVNYTPISGTFTFTNGQTATNFSVTVRDAGVASGNTTVLLQLQNPVGRAVLANPSAATLNIIDTDGELIVPAGLALTSGPANGLLGTNETVTMLFGLRDAAGTNTVSLTSTLLATNGISSPSGPQNYGALAANGPSTSRPYTFTINGTNGQTIAATFQVHDTNGPTNTVVFNLLLGSTTVSFSNTAPIIINDTNPATPYPSVINVSSINGLVNKATVMVTNMNHTWPSDIDMLLESPSGASSYLMSKCGGSVTITNVTLTFDDAAGSSLPQSLITSGTYKPTSFASAPPPFPVPAPPPNSGPPPFYNTNLSAFTGSNPNGAWSLFIIDDTPRNQGGISNGWVLNLITTSPILGASDVGIAMIASAPNVVAGNNLTYTISVTNYGPSTGSNIVVSDTLPVATAYVNATASQGSSVTNGAGLVTWSVGTLAVNAGATLTLVVQPGVPGTITNTATVTTGTQDPNPADSGALVVTTVSVPTADLAMTALVSTPNVLQPPGQLTYSLGVTISNQGPALAPSTIIVVTLPPSVNFLSGAPGTYSVSGAPGTYSVVTNTVTGDVITFNVGDLAVGAQASVSVSAQPTAAGQFLNNATCSSGITDPFKANNSLPAVKTVVQGPTSSPNISSLTRANGNNFVLRGGNGMPGWTCYVLASTNLSAPRSSWTQVGTGYFDASGNLTLTITNAINPAVSARFYLIEEP